MRVQKKRRKQNKTDYKLRIGLLKSSIPRIVIRKTNKYLIVQAVETEEAKDKIINGINSKDLLKNGWDKKLEGSLKSMPAAYLTGLLMAKKTGKGNFILDIGMAKHLKGSRICAVAKGLVDGGLNTITRKTRGDDINAACGQLVGKVLDRTKRSERIKLQMADITP